MSRDATPHRAANPDRSPNLWHRPRPGPGYWDWRCMTCDQAVSDHPILLRRLWHRWKVCP